MSAPPVKRFKMASTSESVSTNTQQIEYSTQSTNTDGIANCDFYYEKGTQKNVAPNILQCAPRIKYSIRIECDICREKIRSSEPHYLNYHGHADHHLCGSCVTRLSYLSDQDTCPYCRGKLLAQCHLCNEEMPINQLILNFHNHRGKHFLPFLPIFFIYFSKNVSVIQFNFTKKSYFLFFLQIRIYAFFASQTIVWMRKSESLLPSIIRQMTQEQLQ